MPVYTMCMQKLFTYICNCIRIFECEAHFDVIIVPASVWGYKVIESSTCFTVWDIFTVRDEIWSFRREQACDADSSGASEFVGSVRS